MRSRQAVACIVGDGFELHLTPGAHAHWLRLRINPDNHGLEFYSYDSAVSTNQWVNLLPGLAVGEHAVTQLFHAIVNRGIAMVIWCMEFDPN